MNKKKVMALGLAAVMTVSSLAGCGSNGGDGNNSSSAGNSSAEQQSSGGGIRFRKRRRRGRLYLYRRGSYYR